MNKSIGMLIGSVAVFAVVVGGAVALAIHAYADRQAWHQAVAAHHAAIAECKRLGEEAKDRVVAAFRAGMSYQEFERQFYSDGKSMLRALPPGTKPDATHQYTHEPSHRVFDLNFVDGVLRGYGSHYSGADAIPYLPTIEQRMAELRGGR